MEETRTMSYVLRHSQIEKIATLARQNGNCSFSAMMRCMIDAYPDPVADEPVDEGGVRRLDIASRVDWMPVTE